MENKLKNDIENIKRKIKDNYSKKEKNYITQYDIFDCFNNKEEKFIFLNIIKRNLKPKFRSNYLYKGKLKQNIGYYSLEEILNLLYYKAKKHKSYNKIYNIYKQFIDYIKQKPYNFNKHEKMIIFNFPKPKYHRKGWKKYKQLKDEINRLKKAKRKIKKKYFGKVLEEKLNNINKEIENLKRRRDEILLQLN